MNNPDFNFSINLAGVAAASGGTKLPTGYYMGKIIDAYHRTATTGRDMIEFRIEITDAEYAGVVRTTRLNVPTATDDKVRHFWRSFVESIGFTAQQIDGAGDIDVNRALFMDKVCHIHYVEGDRDAGVWDQTNVIGSDAWKVAKAADKVANTVISAGQSLGGGLGGGISQVQSGGLGQPVPTQDGVQTPQGLLASLGASS